MSARVLEARVPDTVMPAGLYVRIGGAEYRVIRAGGWALWSLQPTAGFGKVAGGGAAGLGEGRASGRSASALHDDPHI